MHSRFVDCVLNSGPIRFLTVPLKLVDMLTMSLKVKVLMSSETSWQPPLSTRIPAHPFGNDHDSTGITPGGDWTYG